MNKYYEFPADIRGQLFHAAEGDQLHYLSGSEPLYYVTGRQVEKSRFAGDGVETHCDGIKPLNMDYSLYPKVNSRFANNYLFSEGLLVTPSLLVGADFVGKSESKAYIKMLIDKQIIVEVGCTDAGIGGLFGKVSFKYTPAGIDAMLDMESFAHSRLIKVRTGTVGAKLPPYGKLIISKPRFSMYLAGGALPANPAGAGWLISESMTGGLESLTANGLDVADGGTLDTEGIHLSDSAAAILRDLAVLARSKALYPDNSEKAFSR